DDSDDEDDEDDDDEDDDPDDDNDDDNDDEDDDSDDDEDDDEDCPVEVGQWIKWTYKKKKLVGEVVKINTEKELIKVKSADQEKPHVLDWDEDFSIVPPPKDGGSKSKPSAKPSRTGSRAAAGGTG